MNRFNLILLFLIITVIGCSIRADVETDKAEITKALNLSAEHWNNGDMEAYMEVYWNSEKLQFIGANGITYGWKQTLENYKKRYPTREHTGTLRFEILSLEPASTEVYLLTGKYFLERAIGNAEGIFTLVFKKIDEKWVIISDHTQ